MRKSSAHAERRASAARHRSAWASASSRPPRFEDALRTAAGRRGLVPAKWRTTSADERGGSRRRAREVRGGRTARPTVAPKRARPRGSERALDRLHRSQGLSGTVWSKASRRIQRGRGRSRMGVAACASSLHRYSSINGKITHLEPRRAANSSPGSIGVDVQVRQQTALAISRPRFVRSSDFERVIATPDQAPQ